MSHNSTQVDFQSSALPTELRGHLLESIKGETTFEINCSKLKFDTGKIVFILY